MKRRLIQGSLFIIIGLLIAIGPFTIFHVCPVHDNDMIMKCHWTAMAELGQGIGISILGFILLIQKSYDSQAAVSLSLIVSGILAYLIPNVLIGVCDGIHMHCHAAARSAISLLGILTVTAAVINTIYLYRKGRSTDNEAQNADDRQTVII